MKSLIIASTSTLHNQDYLEYLLPEIQKLFRNCSTIIFIPYARPSGISHEEYTEKAAKVFAKIGLQIKGIHEFDDPIAAIKDAEGFFTGGGNTFLLVLQLYQNNIMRILTEVINNGTPYLGTSAGSNICGQTMQTTNDMPIVYPPSFQTLGIIPFNINPHYIDSDSTSKHMGESRETRIKEFHEYNNLPVLGLREGSWLEVKGEQIILKGKMPARLFKKNKSPIEMESESDLSELK